MAESSSDTGDALSATGMASLMALDRAQPLWPDSDLADLLRHQLAAPLLPDLRQCPAIGPATLADIEALMGDASSATFGQLLLHPALPLPVLHAVKDFGKFAAQQDGPLPSEIAHLLYYVAIVAALVRHDQRITSVDPASLRRGVEWVTQQPWTDPATRDLCLEGLAKLNAIGTSGGPS